MNAQLTGEHQGEVHSERLLGSGVSDDLVNPGAGGRGAGAEQGVQHREVEARQERASELPVDQRAAAVASEQQVAGQRIPVADLSYLITHGQEPLQGFAIGVGEVTGRVVTADAIGIVPDRCELA
jgi:hypothetical protein